MSEWWRGAVIYQIYPRSFRDTNGNGIGDLPGIASRLDYVASLGVDGIWLSPFFTSPMKDFGYDIADYRDVDPRFGTLADFDALLAKAHRLGLKVIIDQVYSHSSNRHPWFEESRQDRTNPKADWYVWVDPKPDGGPPNNWLAVFGGPAWDWEPRRHQYYLHNFLKEQPDLNLHNPQVQQAVLDVAAFWLDRGVDGFRLDVANFFMHDPQLRDNPPRPHPAPDKPSYLQRQIYNRTRPETLAFVPKLRALLDRYGECMAVAEIAAEDQLATMVAYTDGPERYHTAYSFVFLGNEFGARFIRDSVERMRAMSDSAWPSWAFSNHDVVRVATRWGRSAADPGAFAKLMLALLTSLRGTVFLYQGEELGLPHAEVPFDRLQDPEGKTFWPRHKGRDGARTPMPWLADAPHAGFSSSEPWLPIDPRHPPLAVDAQEADPDSVLAFARHFLAWRNRQAALIGGDIRFLDTAEPVLAFVRGEAEAATLCVFNLGDADVRAELPAADSATPLAGHGLPGAFEGRVARLPAYGAAFARLVGGGDGAS
ncbi:MAG: alpha glucosidase [Rhodospirillales bacterium]|nr:alpha glucosidase [Rhodospirillales bacterium]